MQYLFRHFLDFLLGTIIFSPTLAYIQWFSNCVPRHFGVPSEIQRVPQFFFVNTKYSRLSIEIWLIFQLKVA
jgi:hypothetical protein